MSVNEDRRKTGAALPGSDRREAGIVTHSISSTYRFLVIILVLVIPQDCSKAVMGKTRDLVLRTSCSRTP
jgi:hypothetical protein